MAKKYQKAFDSSIFKNVKQPTFTLKGVEYLNCGIDLRTNIVTIKNIKSGNYGEIDFYKLQKKLKDDKKG
ncbi:MAG: hypothetical protein GY760_07215 [Deltaproteobacteria bacterium]|nr:hypothetical protein [Deltaproteobacteria bacterium]